jgi:hypothetical protein
MLYAKPARPDDLEIKVCLSKQAMQDEAIDKGCEYA